MAIIAVLFTHASDIFFQSGAAVHWLGRLMEIGWCGVDLFFVLSGFLITGILIDTKPALNRGRSFYARRILRIFPIYYLTISLVLIAQVFSPWVRSVAEISSWQDSLPYLFYYQDLAPLWHHGQAHETLLSHFWSLAVEEQFYFVWPLVVWTLATKSIYKLCGIALCVGLVLRVVLGAHFGFGAWILFFPLARADGLFVGSAIAALFATGHRFSKRSLAGFSMAGLLAMLIVALTGYQQFLYGGPYMCTIGFSGLAILFGVLIAFCLEFEKSFAAKFFRGRWIRAFGRYSYGLYVFHPLVYFLLAHVFKDLLAVHFPLQVPYAFAYLGLLIGVSYGVAWLSFNYFEQRFLRLKGRFEPVFFDDTTPAFPLPAAERR